MQVKHSFMIIRQTGSFGHIRNPFGSGRYGRGRNEPEKLAAEGFIVKFDIKYVGKLFVMMKYYTL